ncbi:MAG TPA: site-specific integrase [Microvirga sp.]|nr:site-specific integrase [Microvirga sp.]
MSLATKDKAEARRRGAELTHTSDEVSEEVRRGQLTPDEAKAILLAVARRQLQHLDRHAALDRQRPEPEPMSGERADRIVGAVYRLLAERGRTAALAPQDAPFLASCGLAADETDQVAATLNVFVQTGVVPPVAGKLKALLNANAPEVVPTPVALAQAETAYYRGMAAACLHLKPRWAATVDDDLALLSADSALDQSAPIRPGLQPTLVHVPGPVSDEGTLARSPSPQESKADAEQTAPTLLELAEGLIATKLKLKAWEEKTARQVRQTATLFVKVTAKVRIGEVRQEDAATYHDTLLHRLPKNYGKSAKDSHRTLDEIIAAARERDDEQELGLEGATLNRHLTHLGNILTYAASRGIKPAETINFTVLRAKKKERDRDARPPFTLEELSTLLRSPVWHGCSSEDDRLSPGSVIAHDALYWAPLIAAYSLMRREEVCGLMVADVVFEGDIPHFNIRANKYRRLKNLQSKRRLPIHPELLRLGLRAYVEEISGLGFDLLFPELLPASGKAPLGDQFYDDWAPMLRAAIPRAQEKGLVFHSIRHYGNDQLTDRKVMTEWRQDIMGQGGKSEVEERYRDETRLRRKLSALKKLPVVTGDIAAASIRLRRAVTAGVRRRPKQRRSK